MNDAQQYAERQGGQSNWAMAAGFPTQLERWGDAKAAHRLLDRPKVALEAITAPHREMVRQEAETAAGPVLFVQDDSYSDLAMHNAMSRRGRIGNDGGFGFLARNEMASPGGKASGLASSAFA